MTDVANKPELDAAYEESLKTVLETLDRIIAPAFSSIFFPFTHLTGLSVIPTLPDVPYFDTALALALEQFDRESAEFSGVDTAFEPENDDVEVELERRVIQRRSGVDPNTGMYTWVDTGFEPDSETIDNVRADFADEIYREVIIVDEEEFVEDTPEAEQYRDLEEELDEVKEQVMVLKAEISYHVLALGAVREALQEALYGTNNIGDKLKEIEELVSELDLDGLTYNGIAQIVSDLKDSVEGAPLVFNTSMRDFSLVAKAVGLEGRFNTDFTPVGDLPGGEKF